MKGNPGIADGLVVRVAKRTDADALANLRILMQCDVHGLLISDVPDDYHRTLRSYFQDAVDSNDRISIVAEIEGKVVAAATYSTYQKPPSIKGGNGIVAHLSNVYTLPEFRRHGIGQRLIAFAVEDARARGFCRMELASTPAGQGIYQMAGFRASRFAEMVLDFT